MSSDVERVAAHPGAALEDATDAEWIGDVLDRVGVGVFVVDHGAQTIAKANDACARLIGASSGKDLVGHSILRLYSDPKERAEIAARLLANDEFRRSGLARIQVRRIRQDTRELVDVSIGLAAEFDADGRVRKMDCVMHEIGDSRVDERAFRLSEERFRVLFDTNQVAMALTDLNGRMSRVNGAFCRFSGRDEHELLGCDFLDLFYSEDRPERPVPHASLDGFALGDRRFVRADGRPSWGVVTGSWLSDGGDAPHSAVIVIVDVTHNKQVEQRLQRVARLESLGALAGGIAHDFNNTLAMVMISVELALRQTDLTPLTREMLNDASRAAKSSAALARQLLTFSKGGAPSKRVGSMAAIVREAADLCVRGSNATVDFDLDPDLWRCDFDPAQMGQVFNNLIINAIQAMPEGGRIHVAGCNVRIESNETVALEPGAYVRISVRDEGRGIDPFHVDHVFDPYFTTKPTGSGLGLATAHSIVARHGGLLTADTSQAGGATFVAFIPASHATAPVEIARDLPPPLRGSARILIMDDEEGVRRAALRVLSLYGVEADCVSDGTAAIEAYQRAVAAGRPYDAVILDLTVPAGMGGEETFERLRAIDPAVRAVVSSGYAASPIMAEWRTRGFAGALEKPFGADVLTAVLGAAIRA